MKTRWLISGSLFLVVMAVLVVLLTPAFFRHGNTPGYSMVFGGITERFIGKTHAEFWSTNGPQETSHQLTEISRMVGGAWTNEAPFLGGETWHNFQANSFTSFTSFEQPHEARLLYIPVRDPSSPLRVVMLCRERSPFGLRERLETYYAKLTKKASVVSLRGRSYSLTNEIPPAAMTNADEAELIREVAKKNPAAGTNNIPTDELVRLWSCPGLTAQERAQVVKSYFPIGTPIADVVAKLGTNYTIDNPMPARPPMPGSGALLLRYSFGEEAVFITTTACGDKPVLSARFLGTGFSVRVTPAMRGEPNGAGALPNPTAR